MKNCKPIFCFTALATVAITLACDLVSIVTQTPPAKPAPSATPESAERETAIPAQAVKMSPESDEHPPILYSADFANPVPVLGGINTAGAEDGPFILPDGNTFYFFFTPDVSMPVEQQISDGVTGLYVSRKVNGEWGKAERIILQDPGKLAMDGCEYVSGNVIWFCSAREGYDGLHWFTAEFQNGVWQNWRLADFAPEYKVGELHFSRDGTELYFHSDRPGGKGGLDVWLSKMVDGIWQAPVNVAAVNTADSEGWPALNPAEDELWITRNYGIWRSKKINGEWQEAELIVSPLAGEATLDSAGNLYFTHHFYHDNTMIEADIYVAYKK